MERGVGRYLRECNVVRSPSPSRPGDIRVRMRQGKGYMSTPFEQLKNPQGRTLRSASNSLGRCIHLRSFHLARVPAQSVPAIPRISKHLCRRSSARPLGVGEMCAFDHSTPGKLSIAMDEDIHVNQLHPLSGSCFQSSWPVDLDTRRKQLASVNLSPIRRFQLEGGRQALKLRGRLADGF